jgi:hypothetical protein
MRKFTWKLRPVIANFESHFTNVTLPNELDTTLQFIQGEEYSSLYSGLPQFGRREFEIASPVFPLIIETLKIENMLRTI